MYYISPHRLTVSVLIILTIGVRGVCCAHQGTQLYTIPELTDSDIALLNLHDGSVSDWETLVGEPVLTNENFGSALSSHGTGSPLSPDLDIRVFMGWNASSSRLYLAVERLDDVYINEYDKEGSYGYNLMWANDSIEFMVDGDHSGSTYVYPASTSFCEIGIDDALKDGVLSKDEIDCIGYWYLSNRHAQSYTAIAEGSSNRLLRISRGGDFDTDKEWLLKTDFVEVGGSAVDSSPHRSIIELYVTPFDSLDNRGIEFSQISQLEPNQIIGLQLILPDFDQAPRQYDGIYSLEGVEPQWSTSSDAFVDFILSGSSRATSSVKSVSWAQIKAGFGPAPLTTGGHLPASFPGGTP